MDGSDAMALSMIVSIPDLVHTYMEPMETATSNLHASGLTYSPQCSYISPPSSDDDFQGGPPQLSHCMAWMGWSDAMALSMIVSIPDLVHTCMEPMETARDNLHACGLT